MSKLTEAIHTTQRRRVWTNVFQQRSEMVSLDFLGIKDIFINDFGMLWRRGRLFVNKKGRCVGYALPTAILDVAFPYPWVNLTIDGGKLWIPVNQILGWAFAPTKDTNQKYFISVTPGITPLLLSSFKWQSRIDTHKDSYYCAFMEKLYA